MLKEKSAGQPVRSWVSQINKLDGYHNRQLWKSSEAGTHCSLDTNNQIIVPVHSKEKC